MQIGVRVRLSSVRCMEGSVVLAALLASGLLVGCAATIDASSVGASWANRCYTMVDEDTRRIVSDEAIDCGLLPLDATKRSRAFAEGCAQQALAERASFRVGYVGFGDDSMYCVIALRSPDGQLWELFFDSDRWGAFGTRGNQSQLRLSRCTAMRPDSLSFDQKDCVEDADAAERYIWSWRENH